MAELRPELEERLLVLARTEGLLDEDDLGITTVPGRAVVWGARIDALVASGRLSEDDVASLVMRIGSEYGDTDTDATRRLEAEQRHRQRSSRVAPMTSGEPARGPETGQLESDPTLGGWERYQLEGEIGRGGMGVVYRAWDRDLERPVALKFIRGDDPELIRRFVREARAQARVDHPNVCSIFEVGQHGGRLYIAMQLVDGTPLSQLVDALRPEQSVEVVRVVAEAVHEAHRLGLIHRDLKPANIMVEQRADGSWSPTVLDFGLARSEAPDGLTVTGMAIGTPGYMAPEQIAGDVATVDRRCDVYALGATLYHLLAGQPPFHGGSQMDLFVRALHDEAPSPRSVRSSIPKDLETIVLTCLERDPGRRYGSARELAEDLQRYLNGSAILARRDPVYRFVKLLRRHRAWAAAAAMVLLVVASSGGVVLRQRWLADRQSELAQAFGHEARDAEWLLRLAHCLPLHDLRDEYQEVRERMGRIETEIERIGDLARGPGEAALGRAAFELGEIEQAVAHLQAAWDSGYRGADVAYSLGLALARRYQSERIRVEHLRDEEHRQRELEEIDATLRDPAVRLLQRGRDARTGSVAYADAMVDLLLGRDQKALAGLEDLAQRETRQWQASHRSALLRHQLALDAARIGEYARAEELYAAADTAFLAAAERARSDPKIHLDHCAMLRDVVEDQVHALGAGDAAARDRALAACQRALVAVPDMSQGYVLVASVWQLWAEWEKDHGKDLVGALRRAEDAARRAIELAPNAAEGHRQLGSVLWVRAEHLLATGEEAGAALEGARDSYRTALAVTPADPVTVSNLGVINDLLGREAWQSGNDPLPHYRAAMDRFREASELQPGNLGALINLGVASTYMAQAELELGNDPRFAVAEAVTAIESALEINDAYADAYNVLGSAHDLAAAWMVDHDQEPEVALSAAAAAFRRAVDLRPDHAGVHGNLARNRLTTARWLLDHDRNSFTALDQALESARRSETISPNRVSAPYLVFAVHLLAAGATENEGGDPARHFEAAEAALRRALAFEPMSAGLYSELVLLELSRTASVLRTSGHGAAAAFDRLRAVVHDAEAKTGAELPDVLLAQVDVMDGRVLMASGRSPLPALERARERISVMLQEAEPDPSLMTVQASVICGRGDGLPIEVRAMLHVRFWRER